MANRESDFPSELTLAESAQELHVSWAQAWTYLLRGRLSGRKNGSGRWVVTRNSVERLRKELSGDSRPAA